MARFEGLREELQSLGDKISELEMDAEEHRLVLAALAPLPPTRKCYRRIGGILTEGNVSTTVPVLEANVHGLDKTIAGLKDVWKRKEGELVQVEKELKESQ